jgi:hypothetical protein
MFKRKFLNILVPVDLQNALAVEAEGQWLEV